MDLLAATLGGMIVGYALRHGLEWWESRQRRLRRQKRKLTDVR